MLFKFKVHYSVMVRCLNALFPAMFCFVLGFPHKALRFHHFLNCLSFWKCTKPPDRLLLGMCDCLPVTDVSPRDKVNRPCDMALNDLEHQHDQCQWQGQLLHACLLSQTQKWVMHSRVLHTIFSNNLKSKNVSWEKGEAPSVWTWVMRLTSISQKSDDLMII